MKRASVNPRKVKRPSTSSSEYNQGHYRDYLKRLARKRDELILHGDLNLAHALERLRLSSMSDADNIRCLLTRHASIFPTTANPIREKKPVFTFEEIMSMAFPIQGKQITLSKQNQSGWSGDDPGVNETANNNLKRFMVPPWCCPKKSKPKKYLFSNRNIVTKRKVEGKSETYASGLLNIRKSLSISGSNSVNQKGPILKVQDLNKALSNCHLYRNSNALPSTDSANKNMAGVEMRHLPFKLDCLLEGKNFLPNNFSDTTMTNVEPKTENFKMEFVPVVNSLVHGKMPLISQDPKPFKLDCLSVGDHLDSRKLNRLYNSYDCCSDTDNVSKMEQNTLPRIREEQATKNTTKRSLSELPDLPAASLGKTGENILPKILKEQIINDTLNRQTNELPELSLMSLEKGGETLLPRISKDERINGMPKSPVNEMPELPVRSLEKSRENLLPRKPKEELIKFTPTGSFSEIPELSVKSLKKREENDLPKEQSVDDTPNKPTNGIPELTVTMTSSEQSCEEKLSPTNLNVQTLNKIAKRITSELSVTSSDETEDETCFRTPTTRMTNDTANRPIIELSRLFQTSTEENADDNEEKTLPRIQNETMTNDIPNSPFIEMSEDFMTSSKENEEKIAYRIRKEQAIYERAKIPIIEMSEMLKTSFDQSKKKTLPSIPQRQLLGSGRFFTSLQHSKDKPPIIQKEESTDHTPNLPVIEMPEMSVTSLEESDITLPRIWNVQTIYDTDRSTVSEQSECSLTSLEEIEENALPRIQNDTPTRPMSGMSGRSMTSLEECEEFTLPSIRQEQMMNCGLKRPISELSHLSVTSLKESEDESSSRMPTQHVIKDVLKCPISERSDRFVTSFDDIDYNTLPRIQNDQTTNHIAKRPFSGMSQLSLTSLEDIKDRETDIFRIPDIYPLSGNEMANENVEDVSVDDVIVDS